MPKTPNELRNSTTTTSAWWTLCSVGIRVSSLLIVSACCLGFFTLEMLEENHILKQDESRLWDGTMEAIETPDSATASSTYSNQVVVSRSSAHERKDWELESGEPGSLSSRLSGYGALYEHIEQQRQLMEDAAQANYSHYYQDLFYENTTANDGKKASRGKLAFFNAQHPQGWDSLKDRLKAKVLSVQEALLLAQQDSSHSTTPVQWIHTLAGSSTTAGHGNFASESYGAVLDAALAPVFESVGIRLETRVYGMSGKPSCPEMALCQEAILGTDVDLVTWDYGMTDGRVTKNFEYWMQRASLIQSRPVLVAHHLDKIRYRRQVGQLRRQQPHLPLLVMDDAVVTRMEKSVPDSYIDTNLPPLLKNLKCGTDFLEATAACKNGKFRRDVCEERRWMTSWHPGYKRLALWGNLYALFLVDALQEAVQELQTEVARVTLGNVQKRRRELQTEKEQQVQRVLSSSYQPKIFDSDRNTTDLFPGVDPSWFYLPLVSAAP